MENLEVSVANVALTYTGSDQDDSLLVSSSYQGGTSTVNASLAGGDDNLRLVAYSPFGKTNVDAGSGRDTVTRSVRRPVRADLRTATLRLGRPHQRPPRRRERLGLRQHRSSRRQQLRQRADRRWLQRPQHRCRRRRHVEVARQRGGRSEPRLRQVHVRLRRWRRQRPSGRLEAGRHPARRRRQGPDDRSPGQGHPPRRQGPRHRARRARPGPLRRRGHESCER